MGFVQHQAHRAGLECRRDGDTLVVAMSGNWTFGGGVPGSCAESIGAEAGVAAMDFDMEHLEDWDSALLAFLVNCLDLCKARGWQCRTQALPENIRKLIELSREVEETEGARRVHRHRNFFEFIGEHALAYWRGTMELFGFIGEICLGLGRLLCLRAKMRPRDVLDVLYQVGAQALPITAMIAFLVGLIIAFLGSVTLSRFGANYYVSYLVGYGMLREMGAIMTGIIMAGRTGAAFAAKLGSMKVTEEIDALRTLGISPIDFLVLPRLIAMFLMMPLLVIYADIIGIAGGLLISTTMLDISQNQFFIGMNVAVDPPDFWLGIVKGFAFGIIVATSGCLRGLQCGKGSDAVGVAATSAVVTGITLIIIFNAIIDWLAAIYNI